MLGLHTALARAALLAAIAAAVPAAAAPGAAPRTGTSAPPRTGTAPAAGTASAQRTGTAVPLPPPPAGTALVARPARREIRLGGLIGMSSAQGNGGGSSLLLQADAAMPWRTTPSGLSIAWALPVRTIILSSDDAPGVETGGFSVEVTPTLRASVPLGRSKFSLRTDTGIGVVARWLWTEQEVMFIGRRTTNSQDTTGVLRVGIAFDYALRPGMSIALEPLSFGYDLDGNADWNFGAGAAFRL